MLSSVKSREKKSSALSPSREAEHPGCRVYSGTGSDPSLGSRLSGNLYVCPHNLLHLLHYPLFSLPFISPLFSLLFTFSLSFISPLFFQRRFTAIVYVQVPMKSSSLSSSKSLPSSPSITSFNENCLLAIAHTNEYRETNEGGPHVIVKSAT